MNATVSERVSERIVRWGSSSTLVVTVYVLHNFHHRAPPQRDRSPQSTHHKHVRIVEGRQAIRQVMSSHDGEHGGAGTERDPAPHRRRDNGQRQFVRSTAADTVNYGPPPIVVVRSAAAK